MTAVKFSCLPDSAEIDPRRVAEANHRLFETSAAFYDAQFTGRRAEADFYVAAAVGFGGPVVEVGCGTGQILAPIVAAGIPATGVDHSGAMLAAAWERCSGQVGLVHADLRRAPDTLPPVRQVLFTSGVLQYALEDQAGVLSGYAARLTDGGRLLIDVKAFWDDPTYRTALDMPITIPQQIYPHPDGSVTVATTISIDRTRQVVTERVRHTVISPDRTLLEDAEYIHIMRSYNLPELLLIAELAGLRVVEVRTRYSESAGSPEAVVGARYILDIRP
ncbi:trans-aconitate 2-methyltransferase [Frankia sp. CiP3]|uniref:class I SAM-dependent methyltransferase n=2 Tax=unclassified Frankia TaxID=2632575 RepID=UPI001EF4A4CB|nr:class I SAM-dependent methyltransferase [Frankia sp. CiP3]